MKTSAELKRAMEDGTPLEDFEHVAAGFVWLVENGAQFYLTETDILFSMPGVCEWCAQALPDEDWKQDYYIDLITPNLCEPTG